MRMKIDCGYTENYLKEQNRMTGNCEIDCKDCPISDNNNKTNLPCGEFERTYPDEAIKIVQKWSDEHQVETRAEHFLKMYPNARMHNNGHPNACVKNLDNNVSCEVCLNGCKKCWDKPYEDGEF
nr:MAG TPA: hypothetical protein [Caudoviricetes sp.]